MSSLKVYLTTLSLKRRLMLCACRDESPQFTNGCYQVCTHLFPCSFPLFLSVRAAHPAHEALAPVIYFLSGSSTHQLYSAGTAQGRSATVERRMSVVPYPRWLQSVLLKTCSPVYVLSSNASTFAFVLGLNSGHTPDIPLRSRGTAQYPRH